MTAPSCPSCARPMILRSSRFGRFLGCSGFPACRETHGVHQATGEPLGIPATKEVRQARHQAHLAFDPLWKLGRFPSRKQAYRWLARELLIPREHCHIGRFSLEDCRRVVELCSVKAPALQEAPGSGQEGPPAPIPPALGS